MIKLVDLILEQDELYLDSLRKRLSQLNDEADTLYRKLSTQSTGYTFGNIFEPTRVNFTDAQEGHRRALLDPQYRELKKRIINLGATIRKVEKLQKKKK